SKNMKKKIILAFSGGLDTSFCVLYLKEQGFDVVTLTVDTGGFTKEEIKQITSQSTKTGAGKHILVDGKKELYEKIISYLIKGNVLRGGVYPLCAGPERLVIAEKLVEIAKKEKAVAVAHGSTGAGNDQVRFDVALKVLAPNIQIITPIRDLGITREEELKVLEKNNIPVSKETKTYSINKGIIGNTLGGKETKTSWETLPEESYPTVSPINKTPTEGIELTISFKQGLPTKINGKNMSGISILKELNKLGATHGVGKGIHLGNTILGIKGRVGFETPAMHILIKAHIELEKLVLSKWQLFWKQTLCEVYGNFLHEALFFDPLMKDIEKFIDSSQKVVTGDVKVKLQLGNIFIQGYESPYSLMNPKVATYGEEHLLWNGKEAAAFGKLYGLQSVLASNAKKIGDAHEKI
ncbi:MAG: argininosuccinate synthase, partial [Candidatus Levyibacteriota bacterium]